MLLCYSLSLPLFEGLRCVCNMCTKCLRLAELICMRDQHRFQHVGNTKGQHVEVKITSLPPVCTAALLYLMRKAWLFSKLSDLMRKKGTYVSVNRPQDDFVRQKEFLVSVSSSLSP